MKLKKIDGWSWYLNEISILFGWFSSYQDSAEHNLIKKTDSRTVFTVFRKDKTYYVKYNHPVCFTDKIRMLFFSKVKSEFKSAEKLRKAGIPVVVMNGYGFRFEKSMLISEELEDSFNARDYWLKTAVFNFKKREEFISELAGLLKKFIMARACHPDFHLGNILLQKADGERIKFVIVDPYGVKVKKIGWSLEKSGVRNILSSFRATLTNAEAYDFLLEIGAAEDIKAAEKEWKSIIRAEIDNNNRQWEGRKKKILSGKSRFCKKINIPSIGECYLRNSITGELEITERCVEKLTGQSEWIDRLSLRDEDAKQFWLLSFFLQFHLIRHVRPIAWVIEDENISKIIIEKCDICDVSLASDDVVKFIESCKDCGLSDEFLKDNIKLINGKPGIVEILKFKGQI